jgi:hypothetical protein
MTIAPSSPARATNGLLALRNPAEVPTAQVTSWHADGFAWKALGRNMNRMQPATPTKSTRPSRWIVGMIDAPMRDEPS